MYRRIVLLADEKIENNFDIVTDTYTAVDASFKLHSG